MRRILWLCGLTAVCGFITLNCRTLTAPFFRYNPDTVWLDDVFAVPRQTMPQDANAETLLPPTVGRFQRVEFTEKICTVTHNPCLSAYYHDASREDSWLLILIHRHAGEITRENLWGARLCGRYTLFDGTRPRKDTLVPYTYDVCNVAQGVGIRSIAWLNDDWIINMGGAYEDISAFIQQYPY
jgi:hypothetical protein